MDPERCAPFGVGPTPGPFAAAGDEPSGPQGAPAPAPHLHPTPPRGPRLTRFPACGPLEPYLPEPAKPPAKYLQDPGPGPALNGGHFYEGPAEGNARRGGSAQLDPLLSFPSLARRGLAASVSRWPINFLSISLCTPVAAEATLRVARARQRPAQCGKHRQPCSRWQRDWEAGGRGRVEQRQRGAHSGRKRLKPGREKRSC